ncbi:hypothetical protein ACWIWK_07800 [Helicobacter sp. 23-1048]
MRQKMRYLVFLVCVVSVSVMLGATPQWSWQRELELQKEQNYRASFLLDSVEKPFVMRWTLYKNYGLLLHIRYDSFNHQVILYKDYQRSDFTLPLGENPKRPPMLHIFFKDFADKKAHLKLYIEGVGASLGSEELGQEETL